MKDLLKKYLPPDGELVLSYRGSPTSEMIHALLELAELRLAVLEVRPGVRKKVIHVLIELLQNIFIHRIDFVSHEFNDFLFDLIREPKYFLVISGNFVRPSQAETLTQKLETYVSMEQEQRRKAYREVLGNGHFNEQGGAGLGLMDIVRKSDGNLTYEFIPVSEDKLFFLMKIYIRDSS